MFGYQDSNKSLSRGTRHDKYQAANSCRFLISQGLAMLFSLLFASPEISIAISFS
jgi:hypothetical protein